MIHPFCRFHQENISIQILILNFPPIQKCTKAFEKFTNSNKFCQNQGQVKEILSYNKKLFSGLNGQSWQ